MPSPKTEWMQRVKSVEREYAATDFAMEFLLSQIQEHAAVIPRDLRHRDFHESKLRLEATYIIRLFAEFETSLRAYWILQRDTFPPMRDVIDAVAARRRIPHDRIDNAHAVREYRNYLVHERDELVDRLPIHTARGHLCYFLSFLPFEW